MVEKWQFGVKVLALYLANPGLIPGSHGYGQEQARGPKTPLNESLDMPLPQALLGWAG